MSNSCNSMHCSLPGSSAHGILQARILEWVAIFFSRESSQPRDWTQISCIGRQILYWWAIREAPILQLSSFIAWSSSLKGGEAESHIAYWNKKGRWESPLWQPPSRNTHLFEDCLSVHVLGGSQSIQQNLSQSEVELVHCSLCGYLQCHWASPWSYFPTHG